MVRYRKDYNDNYKSERKKREDIAQAAKVNIALETADGGRRASLDSEGEDEAHGTYG
jgi:hypothetical protein